MAHCLLLLALRTIVVPHKGLRCRTGVSPWHMSPGREALQLTLKLLCAQELTARAQDSLVSFGERLSTRLFASYMRSQVCLSRCPNHLVASHAAVSVHEQLT